MHVAYHHPILILGHDRFRFGASTSSIAKLKSDKIKESLLFRGSLLILFERTAPYLTHPLYPAQSLCLVSSNISTQQSIRFTESISRMSLAYLRGSSSQTQLTGQHAGPSSQPSSPTSATNGSTSKFTSFQRLRQSLSVAGRRKHEAPVAKVGPALEDGVGSSAYLAQPVQQSQNGVLNRSEDERDHAKEADGYEWEVESAEDELDVDPDSYSWVDPSIIGTERLGASVSFVIQLPSPD